MMGEHMTKRQQQAAETKERITRCAFSLFAEKGIENVTISDICQAAGVSNGNFYHYFSSKDEALLFTYFIFDRTVADELSKRTFDTCTDAILALVYEQTVRANTSPPCNTALLFQAQLRLRGGYVLEKDREFHRYLCQLAQQAIDNGEIHPSHTADEVTDTILRASRGILFDWAQRDGPYRPEEVTVSTVKLLLAGFRQPKE